MEALEVGEGSDLAAARGRSEGEQFAALLQQEILAMRADLRALRDQVVEIDKRLAVHAQRYRSDQEGWRERLGRESAREDDAPAPAPASDELRRLGYLVAGVSAGISAVVQAFAQGLPWLLRVIGEGGGG